MARLNPIQLQRSLSGMTYPARRQDLVARATHNQADSNTLSILEQLPDREYASPTDVNAAVTSVSGTEAGAPVEASVSPPVTRLSAPAAFSPIAMSPAPVVTPDMPAVASVTMSEAPVEPASPQPPLPRTASKVQQLSTSQLGAQKDKLAQALERVGSVMRQGSQSLQQEGQPRLSHYAGAGGEKVEQLSGYLRQADAAALVTKARETARQRSGLVAAGGFVLALLGARVVKSLGQQPQQSLGQQPGPPNGQQPEDLTGAPAAEPELEELATAIGMPAPRRRRRTATAATEAATLEPVE